MLTLSHVIITANRASRTCNNGCSAGGGGIYNLGTLTISNSTITLNSVQVTGCTQTVTFCGAFARGGGISSATGTFAINNTTISGNTTDSKCRVPAPMRGQCADVLCGNTGRPSFFAAKQHLRRRLRLL
jgi:hypothetical protein